MKFFENQGDLFTVSEDYLIAHCISSDFALGAGIAREINKRFDTKFDLFLKYNPQKGETFTGKCLVTDRILNLVTKDKYYQKPTYDSLKKALYSMREYLVVNNKKKGCNASNWLWSG